MEMASWRYTNERLFKAFQKLEKCGFIYRNSDPETYETLRRYREDVDNALLYNDAKLELNDHWGVAHIIFSSPEPNALRHNFTQTEMRTYIILRQLYDEGRLTSGEAGYVSCTYNAFRVKAANIFGEEVLDRGKGYSSMADLERSMEVFKRFSLVDVKTGDKTLTIFPGIAFCMDTEEMEAQCGSILDSWTKKEDPLPEDALSETAEDGDRGSGKIDVGDFQGFFQISLFDGGGQ